MKTPVHALAALLLAALPAAALPEGEKIGDFLAEYCIDCHDDATRKGDLSLEGLGPVDETNAAVWKSIWAQVSLQEMPPKKKDQPEVVERLRFSDWIVGELQRAMEDKGGFHWTASRRTR